MATTPKAESAQIEKLNSVIASDEKPRKQLSEVRQELTTRLEGLISEKPTPGKVTMSKGFVRQGIGAVFPIQEFKRSAREAKLKKALALASFYELLFSNNDASRETLHVIQDVLS